MRLKILLTSIILILLIGVGLFIGFNYNYVFAILKNEKIYTTTELEDEIANRNEDYLKDLTLKIQEIEQELKNSKTENEGLRDELLAKQKEYEDLLTLYNQLSGSGSGSSETQEMLDLLVNGGNVLKLENKDNAFFISGLTLSYENETFYYELDTHAAQKINNVGHVRDWFIFNNVYYGNSTGMTGTEFIRINGDTLEGKVIAQGFESGSNNLIFGTDENGQDCLLFKGRNSYEPENTILKINLNSEDVNYLKDDILNVDDTTLEFENAWWDDSTNKYILNDHDVYRLHQGKFEKCFTMKYLGNAWLADYQYPLSANVLCCSDGIGYLQIINLNNFKTLDLDGEGEVYQISNDVIYFGNKGTTLNKIDVPTMTITEEIGTVKGKSEVHKSYSKLFAECFFIQNENDNTHSLIAAKYGEAEFINIHTFNGEIEFLSLVDERFSNITLRIRESGEEKTYQYNFDTGVFSEKN